MKEFTGIYPALVTPMRQDLTIDTEQIRRLVDFHISAGVDGLWVAGATGEAELLSVDERRILAETVIEAAGGRAKVIVHAGSVAPLESVELAAHAEKCGADAVASTPPHFYAVNDQAIVDHYRRLSESCGLPLFMYHLPGCTHVPVTLPLAERLLEIESVRGIKFSDLNLVLMRQIRNLAPQRLTVFWGMDSVLLAALVMGADGGVGGSYNFMPRVYVRIYELHRSGDIVAAQDLQREAADFILTMRGEVAPVPASKFAVSLQGIECGPPRPPHALPSDSDQQRMRKWWAEHREWLDALG
jgi:N-acetylneuraminate lyase